MTMSRLAIARSILGFMAALTIEIAIPRPADALRDR